MSQRLPSMEMLWGQLSRSVSEPEHWTPPTVGDREGSLNIPLISAIAPVCFWVCALKRCTECMDYYDTHRLWANVHYSTYHKGKNPVAYKPQRHRDCPRNHHTLCHRCHSYTLPLCPLLAGLWWSNSLGKCSHSGRMLCWHQPAASSCPQCT